MNTAPFDQFDAHVRDTLDSFGFPATQYAIAKDKKIIASGSFGEATDVSRFAIMSASKPIFASLVLKLIGDGKLSLETRVVDLWPEFGAGGKDQITVEQLLLFTAGVPDWWPDGEALTNRELRVAEAEVLEPSWAPGTDTAYHPVSAHWILAEIVTRVTGMDHRDALRAELLDPLEMHDLRLGIPVGDPNRPLPIARIGRPRPDQVRAFIGIDLTEDELDAMDDRATDHADDPATIAAGVPGAGMVSNAQSLALFYQHLLHNTQGLWDPQLLRSATSEARNVFPEPPRQGATANRSIGCFVISGNEQGRLEYPAFGIDRSARFFGELVSSRTFGHGGAGGQVALADPERGISFAYLVNGFYRDGFADGERVQSVIDAMITTVDAL